MKFVILVYEDQADFARRTGPGQAEYLGAWRAYHEQLLASGVYVGGHRLQPPEAATTVRVRRGERRIQDGPFAESKEQLGGLIVVDTPSLREALVWAQRCPAAGYAAVEIRPVAPPLPDDPAPPRGPSAA